MAQVGKRGEAAAEIIDRQADAEIGDAAQGGDRGFAPSLDDRVLGKLELEACSIERRLPKSLREHANELRLTGLPA